MPGLASYEKKLRPAGLVVLGVVRKSDKNKVRKLVEKAGVDFPILNDGDLPGVRSNGFPTYVLYDRDGQILLTQTGGDGETGLSNEMRARLEKVLGAKPAELRVDVASYRDRTVAKLATRINQGALPGRLLKEIDAAARSGGDTQKTEAARLRDEVIAFGRKRLDDAAPHKEEFPHRHFDAMEEVARQYKGHALGDEAAAFLAEVKGDPQLHDEIEAARMYENMQQARNKWSLYRALKKKYPGTRFGRKAIQEFEPRLETK